MQLPRSSRQAGFDMVLPGLVFANVTISTTHELVLSGKTNPSVLEAWIQLLHCRGVVKEALAKYSIGCKLPTDMPKRCVCLCLCICVWCLSLFSEFLICHDFF